MTCRRIWQAARRYVDPDKLVFIDETGASTKMTRLYGHALRGHSLRRAALRHDPRAASGAVALRQRLDLRRSPHRGDRPRPQPGAVLHPVKSPESSGMAEAFVKIRNSYMNNNRRSYEGQTPAPVPLSTAHL